MCGPRSGLTYIYNNGGLVYARVERGGDALELKHDFAAPLEDMNELKFDES